MARNLRVGIQRGLRQSIGGGFGTGDVFTLSPASFDFSRTNTKDSRITFTRASSGTFVGADGLIKSAATNTARFDHDPVTGESLGLLIEEAKTNDIATDIGLTSSTSGVSLSEDSSVSKPDGTTGALKITATAGSSVHAAQRTSGATTTNHAFSVFVKKGNHRYIGLSQGGVSNNIHVIFDTDTKTITDDGAKNNGTFVSSGFEEYANGWFRIHMVGFTQGTTLRVFLAQNDSQNGMKNWSATGNEFAYAWGLQREDGDFPTSYIPTSNSAVTRAADVAEITGTNFSSFYSEAKGSVFVQASGATLTGNPLSLEIHDGTTNNRHTLDYGSGDITTVVGGASQAVLATGAPSSAEDVVKVAFAYEVNNFAASKDGGSIVSDASGTVPTTSEMQLGNDSAGTKPLNGHIKRLIYFPMRLADATLQSISS